MLLRKLTPVVLALCLVLVAGPAAGVPVRELNEVSQWSDWGKPRDTQSIQGAIDVAADDRGNVYVSDERNGLIHQFTKSGHYRSSFEAKSPHGLSVDQDKIYNASWGEQVVQVFSKDGHLLLEWGTWQENGTAMSFDLPLFIDVDDAGFIYVTDLNLGYVRKFHSTGTWVTTFGPPGATAVSVAGGRAYVTNPEGTVDIYTLDGTYLKSFGSKGEGDGQFDDPRGIEVAGGYVYVADTFLKRVQQFTLDGVYVSQATDDKFERLDGVGANDRGNVYVADQFTNLVTGYRVR